MVKADAQLSGPGGKSLAAILAEHGFDESDSGQVAAAEAGICERTLHDLAK